MAGRQERFAEEGALSVSEDPHFDETFLQTFLAHQRGLYAYVLMLLPSPPDADDVFQETSIILWRKRHEFQQGTNFNAWASRVAMFAVQNHRAKQARQRRRVTFDDALLQRIAAEAAAMEHQLDIRRAALDGCLAKLPAKDRTLLEQRYAPGATIRSVADAIDRPVEGLYKAMKRIHDALADCVERAMRTAKEPT